MQTEKRKLQIMPGWLAKFLFYYSPDHKLFWQLPSSQYLGMTGIKYVLIPKNRKNDYKIYLASNLPKPTNH